MKAYCMLHKQYNQYIDYRVALRKLGKRHGLRREH